MDREADRIGRLAAESHLGPARMEAELFIKNYGE